MYLSRIRCRMHRNLFILFRFHSAFGSVFIFGAVVMPLSVSALAITIIRIPRMLETHEFRAFGILRFFFSPFAPVYPSVARPRHENEEKGSFAQHFHFSPLIKDLLSPKRRANKHFSDAIHVPRILAYVCVSVAPHDHRNVFPAANGAQMHSQL